MREDSKGPCSSQALKDFLCVEDIKGVFSEFSIGTKLRLQFRTFTNDQDPETVFRKRFANQLIRFGQSESIHFVLKAIEFFERDLMDP